MKIRTQKECDTPFFKWWYKYSDTFRWDMYWMLFVTVATILIYWKEYEIIFKSIYANFLGYFK